MVKFSDDVTQGVEKSAARAMLRAVGLQDEDFEKFYLPFDPIIDDGRHPDIIDMVVEYYTSTEDYEKCAELVKIKNRCQNSETQTE